MVRYYYENSTFDIIVCVRDEKGSLSITIKFHSNYSATRNKHLKYKTVTLKIFILLSQFPIFRQAADTHEFVKKVFEYQLRLLLKFFLNLLCSVFAEIRPKLGLPTSEKSIL